MAMEFSNCEEAPVLISMSATADSGSDCLMSCALQQANSANSLATSSCSCSCSTSTCTDFSSSEGGFDEPSSKAIVAAGTAVGAAVDTSVSLLSLTFSDKSARGSQLSAMKACSALSLIPQQVLQQQQQQQQGKQQHQPLGPGNRPHHHQQQRQRRRSNAISAKSRSSYLAQYNEAKGTYFDGVLAGDIPVTRAGAAPRFN